MRHVKYGVLGLRGIPFPTTFASLVESDRKRLGAGERDAQIRGWCLRCKGRPCECKEPGNIFERR